MDTEQVEKTAPKAAEKPKVRFDELNLSPEVQRAITEMGYEEASAIQAAAIPVLARRPRRNRPGPDGYRQNRRFLHSRH
ncbi:MAG: DEAD/DEAH box helicase [Hymenobacter sp.]